MSNRLLVVLLLALCVVSTYGPTFSGPYLSDDYWLIADAADEQQPWSMLTRFATPMPEDQDPRVYREVWRASYFLDAHLFGLDASVSRLFNALLHAANASLLFFLYRRLLGDRTSAMLAAVLFSVFPVHLSAVAWIAARCDLLAVFFSLCALNVYARAPASDLSLRAKLAVGAFVFLAIQSKETGLIAVPALSALHWHFSPRSRETPLRARLRDLWAGTWWLWVWLAVNLAMRYWVLGTLLGGYSREKPLGVPGVLEQLGRFATAISFPISAVDAGQQPDVLTTIAVIGALTAIWLALRPAREGPSRAYRFTVVWFALTALPLFSLASLSSRNLYQPAAAWCPILVILVHWIARSPGRTALRSAAYAAACGFLIAFSWLASRDAMRPYREGGELGDELFTQARNLLNENRPHPVVLYDMPDHMGPCLVGRNAFPVSCEPPFFHAPVDSFVGITDSRRLQPEHEQALVPIALRNDSLYFRWDPEVRTFRTAVPPILPGTVRGRLAMDDSGGFRLEPASVRVEGERGKLALLVGQFVSLDGDRIDSSEPPVLRITGARSANPMLELASSEPAADSVTLSVRGEPGDQVFLGASARPGFFSIGSAGTLLLDEPIPWQNLLIPPAGVAEISLAIPEFPQPVSGVLRIQAVINRRGEWRIGDLVAVKIQK